jgi:hypothetical protein
MSGLRLGDIITDHKFTRSQSIITINTGDYLNNYKYNHLKYLTRVSKIKNINKYGHRAYRYELKFNHYTVRRSLLRDPVVLVHE